MTGWQGSGRSSDEEETAIHQTRPPAAPGWPQQSPPPLSQPPAWGWGQPPSAPGTAPMGWPGAPGGYGVQPFVTPPKKSKVPLIIAAVVVVLVVLGGGIYYVYDSFGSGDSSGSSFCQAKRRSIRRNPPRTQG